ncbi:MAG: thiamine pyrophosphate-binding protein [Desulforhopalus sp.]
MVTVAQAVASNLKELGVKYVFGVPSGNWVDYMAAIEQVDGLDFVLISNEGSGGFMADVCWRLTGTVAACFGTFGPGACNQTTGVCGGYLDRSPMIAFSDEMNDTMRPRTVQMNIDHQALFDPITKWSSRLEVGRVGQILGEAMRIATSEVPGPVHIGLPSGIGSCHAGETVAEFISPDKPAYAPLAALTEMAEVFSSTEKPIVALGITAIRSNVQKLILQILEKFKIPVVLTPMAKGMVPETHPSYAGILAHALANHVGKTHQQADLIVGIGFDPVELNYEDWIPQVPLLHIDTMPADLDTENFTLGCEVVGNLSYSLQYLLAVDCKEKNWNLEEVAARKTAMMADLAPPPGTFGPRKVLQELRETLPANGIMTCDVGAHLHLIGQQWKTPSPECQLMTNGCSSMGFAIPAAIAAKLCCPEREVCCVVGDGGYAMMAGEMVTAARLGARIVFVVLNDGYLSLISLKQEFKGHSRYGTQLNDAGHSYPLTTAMFGVPVMVARDAAQFQQALQAGFSGDGPVIIETFIDSREYDELLLKGNR